MHRSRKPVRKCHGCGLNFGDYCGVYENPHMVWQRHAVCPGYKNEPMLMEYEAELARRNVQAAKEKRKLVAKERQTETHKNGDQHVVITAVRA
jgi:hypothetical protein